jgi:hypothetical protein
LVVGVDRKEREPLLEKEVGLLSVRACNLEQKGVLLSVRLLTRRRAKAWGVMVRRSC